MKTTISILLMFCWAAITNAQLLPKPIEAAFNLQQKEIPAEKIYLHIDRTLYKPGENIWFKAYIVDAKHQPSPQTKILHVELVNPKGNVEQKIIIQSHNGAAQGDFVLSKNYVGGIYKIRAYSGWIRNFGEEAFFEKDITIQKIVYPKLLMTVDFEKENYSPGDKVSATLNVRTPNDMVFANQSFTYTVQLAGKSFLNNAAQTDHNGNASIQFDLPSDLNSNDGLLNIIIPFEGSRESISRSVPIVLNNIRLDFFPEGGDLLTNTKNNVAFKALNEFGKPADISGVLRNSTGEILGNFESYHQGMGAFHLEVKENESYYVEITKPKGVSKKYKLPKAQKKGINLRKISQSKEDVNFYVHTSTPQTLHFVAEIGGQIFHRKTVENATSGMQTIKTDDLPMGIMKLTVFDEQIRPQTERLVFINQHRHLNINISTRKQKYGLRAQVLMDIDVKDEKGIPVNGNFSLAVVEDKLYTFADDKQDDILSSLLMSSELKGEIHEPNFYFDKTEEKATTALDYVLLTHGWRRFPWKDVLNNNADDWAKIREYEKDIYIYKGIVKINSLPVSKAKVYFDNDKHNVVKTDENGIFQIESGEVGFYNITVEYHGYKHTQGFYASHSRNINNIILKEAPKNKVNAIDISAIQKDKLEIAVQEVINKKLPKRKLITSDIKVSSSNISEVKIRGISNVASAGVQLSEMVIISGYASNQNPFLGSYNLSLDVDYKRPYFQIQNIPNPMGQLYQARQFPNYRYNTSNRGQNTGNDIRKTLYWNPNIRLQNGKINLAFFTSDETSTFRAIFEGITQDGKIGRSEYTFYTEPDFDANLKAPLIVTVGDEMRIPIVLKNNTTEETTINLLPSQLPAGFKPVNGIKGQFIVPANDYIITYFDYKVEAAPKEYVFQFGFEANGYAKYTQHEIQVKPSGFPAYIGLSGMEKDKSFKFEYGGAVPTTLHASFTAYPNVLEELMTGVDAMLREPSGCFEQTSSSNYPNIMALRYMQEQGDINPAIQQKAKGLLERGYKRLASYECSGGGFDWFGKDPAHEALTAYGLLQFKDMKQVYDGVNENMINRAKEWLLSRRDGQGGWKSTGRGYHTWISGATRDAYLVYALSELNTVSLDQEIAKVNQEVKKSKDWYRLGLAILANWNLKDIETANILMDILLAEIESKGLDTPQTEMTITNSTGIYKNVETWSFISLALMKMDKTDQNALLSILTQRIAEQRTNFGHYGSTQTTIMALKTLTEYAKYTARPKEDGKIELYVNTQQINYNYTKTHKGKININLKSYLQEGSNEIRVVYKETKYPLPYTIDINWETLTPMSASNCNIDLQTKLASTETKIGETIRLTATLKNKTNQLQSNPIALISIPGGLSLQPWQLKEMTNQGVFDFYEINGNYLVAYFRTIAGNETKTINLDLKAEIPGTYKGTASSAYLYYGAMYKDWEKGVSVKVLE